MLRNRLRAALPEQGLRDLVTAIFDVAWERHLSRRDPAESPHEHEIYVLEATMRLFAAEGLIGLEVKLFGCVVALLHDLGEIRRVTELDIRHAREQGDLAGAERLAAKRARQRPEHMIASAELAHEILSMPRLAIPVHVRDRAVEHIGLHDMVKLGVPYPPRSDWAAVCCVEADTLWPVSPEGPAADLRRRGLGGFGRGELAAQARANFETQLVAYRNSFPRHERFSDPETFLRTSEGAGMLAEYRAYWEF